MKKLYFLAILFIYYVANAQQGINYKAIINDANGDVLANSPVTIQFTILENGTTDVYSESHNTTTDVNGIIIVNIGEGIQPVGDFNSIDWGSSPHFLKTEIDIGEGLTDMGTTEFKAVPYAFYADKVSDNDDADADPTNELITGASLNGDQLVINEAGNVNSVDLSPLIGSSGGIRLPLYTSAEIAVLTPVAGDAVFNSTENLYQVYDGTSWQVFNLSCWPQPTAANAGTDQYFEDGTTIATLSANTPETGHGTGEWVIISGEGGGFSNTTDPNTIFSGNECATYELQWIISTNCSNSSDNVIVEFDLKPTIAYAGYDQIITDGTTTTNLAGNIPEAGNGTGEWTTVRGEGGSFTNVADPNTSFTGVFNTAYTLRWTISPNCGSNSDDVIVAFKSPSTVIEIGAFYGGGVVFYIFKPDDVGYVSGEIHGLICALSDQSAEWGCSNTEILGADGFLIGTGAQNTIDIETNCNTPGTAADICANMDISGYTDWFLPSRDELRQIYLNKSLIEETIQELGGSTFEIYYWSSSEYINNRACLLDLRDGNSYANSKDYIGSVRAVRTF